VVVPSNEAFAFDHIGLATDFTNQRRSVQGRLVQRIFAPTFFRRPSGKLSNGTTQLTTTPHMIGVHRSLIGIRIALGVLPGVQQGVHIGVDHIRSIIGVQVGAQLGVHIGVDHIRSITGVLAGVQLGVQ